MGVIAAAADQALLGLERTHAAAVHPGDQLFDLAHDLRADAVAGKKKELVGGHGYAPRVTRVVVIPDAATSAFTRVCDALWRRSEIQMQVRIVHLDSGFVLSRAPE
jgi:hypothetical protein